MLLEANAASSPTPTIAANPHSYLLFFENFWAIEPSHLRNANASWANLLPTDMHRRNFLGGLGGAAVAVPFLGSSTRGVAQPPSDPRRFITMFTHHGCITDRWFPARSHGELTAADYADTSLSALQEFAPKLLMPRGIRGINEWSVARLFGQETDELAQPMASFLTAAPVDRTSGAEDGALNFDKLNAEPFGRSMDHDMAAHVNPGGAPPLVIHFGGAQSDSYNTLSYSAPLTKFAAIGTPLQLYEQLTAVSGESEAGYEVAAGNSVLDMVRDDLQTLRRANMSRADRDKLDQWESLLHETSGAVRPALCNEVLAQNTYDPAELQDSSTDLEVQTPLMMDLATLIAACDLNRVIILQFPAHRTATYLDGWDADLHGLSHRTGNATMGTCGIENASELLEQADRWNADRFAYLLNRLDGFEETSGTLLDNSATVWTMVYADGALHTNNNLPILHAGSCGGYFKTGQAINVEDGSADLTPGNSSGICADGQTTYDRADFGTPSDIANVPLNKYFYNLMNAIGVRAGADGFPAIGGSEKVSRFGWSDDPQQFAAFEPADGFENQPGTFIDAGELEDLLA